MVGIFIAIINTLKANKYVLLAKVSEMSDAYSQIIVNRIRALCDRRGISVNKLAEMSGVPQSTLNNLIGNHGATRNPGIQTLHKIATAFNMTVAEFLDFPELNDYSFDDQDNQGDE